MTLKTISQQGLDVAYQVACKEDLEAEKSLLQQLWPEKATKEWMKSTGYKVLEKATAVKTHTS